MSSALSDAGPARNEDKLTPFQQTILVTLAEEARYGLAIKDALEEYYRRAVTQGRLCPNLTDLADWDSSRSGHSTGGRMSTRSLTRGMM